MKTNALKVYLILISVLFLISSCSKPDAGSSAASESGNGKLKISLSDKNLIGHALTQRRMSLMTAVPNLLQGLYFSQLEITAFNYRPGESVQNNPHLSPTSIFDSNGNYVSGTDWSNWVLLERGGIGSSDLVLQPGESIDFSSVKPLDSLFVESVNSFSIDLLEVYLYLPGVIYDHTFYGSNNHDGTIGYTMCGGLGDTRALYKYPAFVDFPFYFAPPKFVSFPSGESSVGPTLLYGTASVITVLFARNDWFPNPVLIQATEGQGYSCGLSDAHGATICGESPLVWSSQILSDQQKSILKNFLSHGTNKLGGGAYSAMIIPISRIDINLNSVGGMIRPDSKVEIQFDVANSINFATSTMAQADFWSGTEINVAYDLNNIPMGLTVFSSPDNQ